MHVTHKHRFIGMKGRAVEKMRSNATGTIYLLFYSLALFSVAFEFKYLLSCTVYIHPIPLSAEMILDALAHSIVCPQYHSSNSNNHLTCFVDSVNVIICLEFYDNTQF